MAVTDTLRYQRVTTVGDFFALLKPRVMSLVVFTGLAGIIAAPGHVHPLTAFTALLCIALAAGASGALNMAYDAVGYVFLSPDGRTGKFLWSR